MASKKIKGIVIEIGGDTTKLGDAIEDVEKKSRSLQGELKQVERLLKMDPGNTDLLAQRQQILTEAVEETTKKLKTLKDAEEQVIEQFNKGDIGEDQLRAFQREIIKTEGELNGFRSELDGTGDDIKDVGDSAEQSGDGFTVMKGALADLVSNVIQGAISKIGDLIGSLMELSEATEEYRTMQAKLEGSSKTFGYSVEFANDKYKEFYKYLGDDQASTNAITNLMGIGTSTESISKLAEGATAVWASYGDSIPIEGLTEAINETITVGKVTGGMADTINWAKDANINLKNALSGNKDAQKAYNDAIKEGLPVEDAFNEALAKITDEQERADVVAQFLNSTYGESKKAYDDLNKSVTDANEAELELKDTQADLGETMAPVNNAITDMKNKALEAITPLVEKLADAFMDLYKWLQENPVAMKILTAVAIALTTAFTVLAGVLAIQGLIRGVALAFQFLNTTLLANPIVLIVALIAGLVAGFIYLWNNCEGFRNFWINLWEKIKTGVKNFIEWFKTVPDKIKAFLMKIFNFIKDNWKGLLLLIVNPFAGAFKLLYDNCEGFRKFIDNILAKIKQLFKNCKNGITNAFANIGAWFSNIFKNAWSGIKSTWSGVRDWFSNLYSKIKNVFSGVGSWFGSVFRKAWTSIKNVFSNWGSFFSGLWNKIKNTFSKLGSSIASAIGNAVKSGINGVISMIQNTINNAIGLINGAISLINKLPGVSVGKIKKLSLPRLAQGGIVDKPTVAMFGEDGREAVIPLEKNTQWLREVGKELSGHLSGGVANAEVLNKLDGIYDRLGRIKMVTETGALVGEILDKIDAGLAEKQLLNARGV